MKTRIKMNKNKNKKISKIIKFKKSGKSLKTAKPMLKNKMMILNLQRKKKVFR